MNGIETPEVNQNNNVAPKVPKHLCDHSESQVLCTLYKEFVIVVVFYFTEQSSTHLSVLAKGLVNLSLYL